MKQAFTRVVALSVLVVAVSVTGLIAAQYDGDRGIVTPDITASEIYQHIKYLASDELKGRFAGTPEEKMAAEYIASEFRKYGLKPAGVDGGYFQHFPFVAGVSLGKENNLETIKIEDRGKKIRNSKFEIRNNLKIQNPNTEPFWILGFEHLNLFRISDFVFRISCGLQGQTRQWRVKEDFAPMAFSIDTEGESPWTLKVAFVGYGISAPEAGYDDYAGLDVSGRLVLALRFTPEGDTPHSKFWRHAPLRAKALVARQRGAKAIAFIADTDHFEANKLSQLEFDFSNALSGIVAIGISRRLANELISTAGTSLDELQKKIGAAQQPDSRLLPNVRARIRVDLVKDTKQTANVIGYLKGNDPKLRDEIIVIGAHHDHLGSGGHGSLAPHQQGEVHNGADDNASGVAGVLELGQAFAARRAELKRSLLFMTFSGEEEGLLGSSYYVKHPVFPLEHTVAMINLDMIGRLENNRLTVQGLGTSPQWEPLLDELKASQRFDLRTTEDGIGPSDHSSFYLKDIPVLFFFTGVHSDYHKPSDDYDRINAGGQARVVEFVYDVVSKIQAWPARPEFAKTRSRERPALGFRVSLGTIPDYSEEVEGVKLSGVRQGGPAEKAGLRAGDIIVRVGSIKIKNIYDYTFALGELKPDEQVEVEVLRDGRSVVLNIAPEPRD